MLPQGLCTVCGHTLELSFSETRMVLSFSFKSLLKCHLFDELLLSSPAAACIPLLHFFFSVAPRSPSSRLVCVVLMPPSLSFFLLRHKPSRAGPARFPPLKSPQHGGHIAWHVVDAQ